MKRFQQYPLGGYGKDHKSSGLFPVKLQPTDDDFHIFGVEWNKEGYIFYTDGVETNRMTEAVSDTEQFILVTTECDGYRRDDPHPTEDLQELILPDEFTVDYVRVWDED